MTCIEQNGRLLGHRGDQPGPTGMAELLVVQVGGVALWALTEFVKQGFEGKRLALEQLGRFFGLEKRKTGLRL